MPTNATAKLLNSASPFFSISSLQAMLNLTRESARTTASRLVKRGILVRIQRDLYTLANRNYSLFSLANAFNQPSVISLETALNYWGIIVQVPQTVFSIAQASYRCVVDNTEFVYRRMPPDLFRFGQVKVEDFFNQYRENTIIEVVQAVAKSEAGSHLAFKGGTALKLFYDLPRYSEVIPTDRTFGRNQESDFENGRPSLWILK